MLVKLQSSIALFTCGCLVSVAASPSSIGFVVANGQAEVDGSAVRGNSTVFQGSLVQAASATSELMFPGGSNLLLQPESAVKVYREYAVLQRGTVTQRGAPRIGCRWPENLLFIRPRRNRCWDERQVACGGSCPGRSRRGSYPAGALVAHLEPGKVLTFAIQASQQAPAGPALQQNPSTPPSAQALPPPGAQLTIHGVLRKDHPGRYGHYLLTDLATKVTFELQGSGLDDLVGASVEATGSIFDATPAEGASKVMSVSDIHQMPLSEMRGNTPTVNTPAAAPPTPSGETVPSNDAGPEVGANPEAKAPPEVSNAPTTPPPLPQHSDTAKIIIIVGIAAGAVVGVALGLGGGKSSTVSPE